MKGDFSNYGGQLFVNDGIPNLQLPNLVSFNDGGNAEASTASAPIIKPSTSWQLQYYGTLYPMIRYSSTVDRQLDFGKRSRIAYAGGAQDPTVSDDVDVAHVTFTHPVTLVQYKAYSVDGDDMSPGYQLLEDANAFLTEEWNPAQAVMDAAVTSLETAQDAGENTDAEQEAVDAAEATLNVLTTRLQEKIHIIDIVRSLSEALEYSN